MKTLGTLAAVAIAAICTLASPNTLADNKQGFNAPLVIGHRGAPGYLPEHTLESYALAIELGADFIEPDLVATKDGHLIARHEPNLIGTTNVKDLPQFAGRKRIAVVDGFPEEGFFASDFTLAEIRTLRAVQPLGDRDPRFNGKFGIPTFEEVIELAKRKGQEVGRTIGVYPETKHPTYHQRLGLALEDRLLDVLKREGWNKREAPVFIQSFETANLKYLRGKTKVKLVQLIDANDINADGIGPWKPYIQSWTASALLAPSTVVADAHRAGLLVHPYTLRNEASRQPPPFGGNPVREYLRFYELGVDAVFSDHADTAFAARAMFLLANDPSYRDCLVGKRDCDKRRDFD